MSIVPPPSAVVAWVLPTPFDVIRCLVWESGAVWVIVVFFGEEPLDMEVAVSRESMHVWVDMMFRHLVSARLGRPYGTTAVPPALAFADGVDTTEDGADLG